jgi:hypothetical protein
MNVDQLWNVEELRTDQYQTGMNTRLTNLESNDSVLIRLDFSSTLLKWG